MMRYAKRNTFFGLLLFTSWMSNACVSQTKVANFVRSNVPAMQQEQQNANLQSPAPVSPTVSQSTSTQEDTQEKDTVSAQGMASSTGTADGETSESKPQNEKGPEENETIQTETQPHSDNASDGKSVEGQVGIDDTSVKINHQTIDSQRMEVPKELPVPKTLAEKEYMEKEENSLGSEITGLVIDDTMTNFGSKFYETFCLQWTPPQIQSEYNLHIIERSNPQWGTIVTINVDEFTVWENRLQPRSADIEEAVEEAQGYVQEFLKTYEDFKKQMDGDDMQGDGIL